MISLDLAGHEQLLAELKTLDVELQQKAIGSALTAFARPLKLRMEANAPVGETGRLKQSIGQRAVTKTAKARLGIDANTVAKLVGPTKKVDGKSQGAKGWWTEDGTKRMSAQNWMSGSMSEAESDMQAAFYKGLGSRLKKLRQQ